MKHRVAGRKLGRTTAHRLALLRNMSTALFDKERITTTLARAKELRPFAEKLVTCSKKETLHARRQVLRHIRDREVVAKLFDVLSARYSQRPGGYTRIVKLGPRRGDNAEMALIELVGAEAPATEAAEEGTEKKGKAAAADEPAEEAPKKAKKTTRKATKKAAAGGEGGEKKKAKRTVKKKTAKKASGGKTGKAK